LARACQASGMATLRFNFRGVGASGGSYDEGRGEIQDALAVIAWGRARWPGAAMTLAGFSFGAMVSLGAANLAAPSKLISIAPAVFLPEFSAASDPRCPWLIVHGDADELVDIRDVRAFAARFVPPPQLVVFPGGEHFFHGRLSELRGQVLQFLKNEEARYSCALPGSLKMLIRREPERSVHHRLQVLQWQSTHLLAGRLRLERHLFAGERIGTFTCLGRRPLDDLQLQQTGKSEQAVAAQALLDDAIQRFEHFADLLAG
jgi:alpha/beta superfamily hydrolase